MRTTRPRACAGCREEAVFLAQVVLVLALVFSLLVAVFAVQNADPVTVKLLAWRFDTSLVIVILAAAAGGAALLALLGVFAQLRLGLQLKSTKGRAGQLQKELVRLEEEKSRLAQEVARLDRELRHTAPVDVPGEESGGRQDEH